ncbi:MAG: hypothetical protein U5N85_13870 [Arcicella sp.]|nr:hypothetical protein [Arcicella sp.]
MPVLPQTDLAGEQSWKTQPIPSFPEPYMRQNFLEKDTCQSFTRTPC